MSGMDGGDAEIAKPFHEGIATVVCVQGAELGLDGRRFFELFLVVLRGIQDAGETDGGVGVDDAGGGDFGSEDLVAPGDFNLCGGADCLDFAIRSAEDDGVFDGLEVAGHGVKEVCFHRDLGERHRGAEKREEENFKHGKGVVGLTIEAATGSFAGMAGSVTAFGVEAVGGVGEVEDFLALDVGFEDAGVDGEGVAGEDDEVCFFPGIERAGGLAEAQHFCAGKGEGFECFLAGHSGADADGGIAKKPAGVVDGIIGVNGGEDAAFFELGSVAPFKIAGFEFSAGGV